MASDTAAARCQDVLNTAVASVLTTLPSTRVGADGRPMTWQGYTTQWQDVQRCTIGGKVSCWGTNIMDVRELVLGEGDSLAEREAGSVPVVVIRPQNWNETVANCPASQFLVVVKDPVTEKASTVPLSYLLQHIGRYVPQRGLPLDMDLSAAVDKERMQVGVKGIVIQPGAKFVGTGNLYGGTDTLFLYCNAQGTSVGVPANGKTSFYAVVGNVHTGFRLRAFVADETNIRVTDLAHQVESKEDAAAALAAGKAVAAAVGPSWLPPSLNTFALVQVPLVRLAKPRLAGCAMYGGMALAGCAVGGAASKVYEDDSEESDVGAARGMMFGDSDDDVFDSDDDAVEHQRAVAVAAAGCCKPLKSSVARVSVDTTDLGPAPSLAEFASRVRDTTTPLRVEIGKYVTVPMGAEPAVLTEAVLQLKENLQTLLFEGLDAPATLAQMDLPPLPALPGIAACAPPTPPQAAGTVVITAKITRSRLASAADATLTEAVASTIDKTAVPEESTRKRLASAAMECAKGLPESVFAVETRMGVFLVRVELE